MLLKEYIFTANQFLYFRVWNRNHEQQQLKIVSFNNSNSTPQILNYLLNVLKVNKGSLGSYRPWPHVGLQGTAGEPGDIIYNK